MAQVRTSTPIDIISGKAGAGDNKVVFTPKGNRNFSRTYVYPAQRVPRTYELEIRAAFASLATAWKDITPPQAAQWEAFGKAHPVVDRIGRKVAQTAMGAFRAYNFHRRLFGEAVHAVPVSNPSPFPGIPGNATVTVGSDGSLDISFQVYAQVGSFVRVRLTRALPTLSSVPRLSSFSTFLRSEESILTMYPSAADTPCTVIYTPSLAFGAGDVVCLELLPINAEHLAGMPVYTGRVTISSA